MTKRKSETVAEYAKRDAEARKLRREKAKAVPHEIIPDGHHVRGVSTLVDSAGVLVGQWIKTARDQEDREAIIKKLVEELPKEITPRNGSIAAKAPASEDLLAVYPLGDPHVGMLAWAEEAGDDFDLAECERLMRAAMRDLVLRGPRTRDALILNLGDFFHADGNGTTTKGTRVNVDERTALVLSVGMNIMVELIDTALEHHETVTVDNRIGNHDGYSALTLSLALAAHYRNEPRVTIPPSIAHRSYYTFGQNLIGVTHGDRAKPEALAEIMAAERPKDWGATKFRVWYCGHVHHSSVKDYRGCKVETFRTLASRDGWHAAEGYVAARDMTRITLHREHGERSREVVNVASLRA